MPQGVDLTTDNPLSLVALLVNLALGIPLALLLSWHFRRFGSTLSNREELGQVFPFILLTTVLIISVVKSSLALSLGLVGALSIVRFRTPIKEPEELAYLFLSIGMGLGLGAGQTVPTILAGVVILGVMAVWKRLRRDTAGKNLYVSIDWTPPGGGKGEGFLQGINEILARHASALDLKRFDVRDNGMEATYRLDIGSTTKLNALVNDLRSGYPAIGVTFLDQNQMPSV